MILNDLNAVRAFSQLGSVTLGGNLSIAAGPIGRNAEASGAANFKAVAPSSPTVKQRVSLPVSRSKDPS